MASKEHSYQPVSSSDDVSYSASNDDERCSNDLLLESHQILRRRSRWIPSPLLASVIALNLLVTALIVIVLTKKPTDQQCSKQLSVYCKNRSREAWTLLI